MSKHLPFYRRSEPYFWHDPNELMVGFETEEQAAERHAAGCRLMVRGKSMAKPNFSDCTRDFPCDTAACALCMREFRRWWVDAGISLLDQGTGPLSAVSLVHHTLSRSPGKLYGFDLGKAKRQLARHIDRAGLGNFVALGGFDFSYNEPLAPFSPHWQPHAYVIFQAAGPNEVKQALSPFYPATHVVPRPVRTRNVTSVMQALTYATKAVFFRRSSYIDATGRPNTRCVRLSTEAERELLGYLDQQRPVDRLFLKNVRRQGPTLLSMLTEASASSSGLTVQGSDGEVSERSLSPKKSD